MVHTAVKLATVAGLLGLVILHPDAFARIAQAATATFRGAVRIAP